MQLDWIHIFVILNHLFPEQLLHPWRIPIPFLLGEMKNTKKPRNWTWTLSYTLQTSPSLENVQGLKLTCSASPGYPCSQSHIISYLMLFIPPTSVSTLRLKEGRFRICWTKLMKEFDLKTTFSGRSSASSSQARALTFVSRRLLLMCLIGLIVSAFLR